MRLKPRLQIVKRQSNKKRKDYLTRLRTSKVCWGRCQFSNNIWKEMTTELRRLKAKYWLRRYWTVGQPQIARATADHGHTGQSEIERSYVSGKSNYCLGRLSQQWRSLFISTSFIDAEPFFTFFSRHSAVIRLSEMVQNHVPLTTTTDSNLRTYYDSANPYLISSSFLSSKGRRETDGERRYPKGYLVTEGISLLLSLESREAVAI